MNKSVIIRKIRVVRGLLIDELKLLNCNVFLFFRFEFIN